MPICECGAPIRANAKRCRLCDALHDSSERDKAEVERAKDRYPRDARCRCGAMFLQLDPRHVNCGIGCQIHGRKMREAGILAKV